MRFCCRILSALSPSLGSLHFLDWKELVHHGSGHMVWWLNRGRNKKAGVWKKQSSSQKEWSIRMEQPITPGPRSREHSVIISFASGIMIKLWIMILINSPCWFCKCPCFPIYILIVLQDQSQDYKMSLESWHMTKYNVWAPFTCCTIPPEEKLAFDNIHAAFTFYSYCQTQS